MEFLISRRRFCRFAALGPLAAAVPPTSGEPTAALFYGQGVRMLREGRTFEKALARFARAAEMEPLNPDYPIALGCAWASRAASISHAALYRQKLTHEWSEFSRRMDAWEAGRAEWEAMKAQNPKGYANEKYDDRKPKTPRTIDFVTKDDKVPFRLTPLQTAARLSELSRQAQTAWAQGIALSRTTEEKAEAYYVQAWGLNVLHRCLSRFSDKGEIITPPVVVPDEEGADVGKAAIAAAPVKTITNTPTAAEAVKAAEEAARLASDNALYFCAVGDLVGDTDDKKAFAAYEKALGLAPKDRNLLYLLYQKTAAKAHKESEPPQWVAYTKGQTPKPDEEPFVVPLGYLRRAFARDGANAWALYEEAGILFRLAPYSIVGPSGNRDASPKEKQAALNAVMNAPARKYGKQAIDLIVTANGSPRYDVPHYKESVPVLLQQAWNLNTAARHYRMVSFSGGSRLRELARSVMGYAQVMAQHENKADEAIRASRANVGMGLRLAGNWPTQYDEKSGKTITDGLVGAAICSIGYKGLMQTYEAVGDKAGAEAAQKESDAFKARADAYQKAIMSMINSDSAYDQY